MTTHGSPTQNPDGDIPGTVIQKATPATMVRIVNGHDHVNDFMVKYHGVMLCYSSTVSTMSYYQENLLGARVFSFSQDEEGPITTYMSYLNK